MASLRRTAGLLICILVTIFVTPINAFADSPSQCSGDQGDFTLVAACNSGTSVTGILYVRDVNASTHQADAAVVAASGGAGVWTVSLVCVETSGKSGPDGEHCAGKYVGCAFGEVQYQVDFTPAGGVRSRIARYCYAATDPTKGLVTAASLGVDLAAYRDQIRPMAPAVRTWPPGGATLVNLITFVQAQSAAGIDRTFGGQGYSVRLSVAPASYAWDFGDGTTLTTDNPGAPPPADGVPRPGQPVHTYLAAAARRTISVRIAYGATYELVTPFGALAGGAVPGQLLGPTGSAALAVQEARAVLTG